MTRRGAAAVTSSASGEWVSPPRRRARSGDLRCATAETPQAAVMHRLLKPDSIDYQPAYGYDDAMVFVARRGASRAATSRLIPIRAAEPPPFLDWVGGGRGHCRSLSLNG